jgi:hypothetical protein
MRKISVVLFLCIIAFSILRAEDKSVIKLVPVYEKTFQDTIVDVIFDTATVSITKAKAMGWKEEAFNEEERRIGKATISYPKVVILGEKGFPFKQKIKFLDKKGNIRREISGKGATRIVFSTNGKYILKALWYDTEFDSSGGAIFYDNNGNVIWKKSEGAFCAITDNGYTATGFISPEGSSYPFIIYDPLGKKIKEIGLPDWRIFDAGICANGEYFIITYRGKAGFDSTGVIMIKECGKIWSHYIIKGGDIYSWNIFPFKEQQMILMVVGKKIIFIDKKGEIKWKVEGQKWLEGRPPQGDGLQSSVNLELLKNKLYFYTNGYILDIDLSGEKIRSYYYIGNNAKMFYDRIFILKQDIIEGFNPIEVQK